MDAPPGTRHSNLKKSFKLGVRSLLTAFSKEVIKSLHKKIEEEFEAVCHESQVGVILDTVEQLVEEQSVDLLPSHVVPFGSYFLVINHSSYVEVVKFQPREAERFLDWIKDEITYLSDLLTKTEQQRELFKARVESLKRARDDTDAAADAITKLRHWNSNYEKMLNC